MIINQKVLIVTFMLIIGKLCSKIVSMISLKRIRRIEK